MNAKTKMVEARNLKAGDFVYVYTVGWRTLTHVRKSRRYPGMMQLQYDYAPGESGQYEIKFGEFMEMRISPEVK